MKVFPEGILFWGHHITGLWEVKRTNTKELAQKDAGVPPGNAIETAKISQVSSNLPRDSLARYLRSRVVLGMLRLTGGAAGHFEPVLRSCSQAMS